MEHIAKKQKLEQGGEGGEDVTGMVEAQQSGLSPLEESILWIGKFLEFGSVLSCRVASKTLLSALSSQEIWKGLVEDLLLEININARSWNKERIPKEINWFDFYADRVRPLLREKAKLLEALEREGLSQHAPTFQKYIRVCVGLTEVHRSTSSGKSHSFRFVDWPTDRGDVPMGFLAQIHLNEISGMVASFEYNLPQSGFMYFFLDDWEGKIVVAEGDPKVKRIKLDYDNPFGFEEADFVMHEYLTIPDSCEFQRYTKIKSHWETFDQINKSLREAPFTRIFGWPVYFQGFEEARKDQTLMFQFCDGSSEYSQYLYLKTEDVKKRIYEPVSVEHQS